MKPRPVHYLISLLLDYAGCTYNPPTSIFNSNKVVRNILRLPNNRNFTLEVMEVLNDNLDKHYNHDSISVSRILADIYKKQRDSGKKIDKNGDLSAILRVATEYGCTGGNYCPIPKELVDDYEKIKFDRCEGRTWLSTDNMRELNEVYHYLDENGFNLANVGKMENKFNNSNDVEMKAFINKCKVIATQAMASSGELVKADEPVKPEPDEQDFKRSPSMKQ